MSELQWKKRDFSTGAISFEPHDYVSNSDLWIKDVSFSVQKNGWELYDNVELLGEFDTLKSAKASEYILNPYNPHEILRA